MTCRRAPLRRRTRPRPPPPGPPCCSATGLPPPPPRACGYPSRWQLRLALAGALALLAPGLAIGALLHVNDILSADLLPGTLFLREGATLPANSSGPAAAAAAAAQDDHPGARARAGNWSDAFLTMNFHR